MAHSARRSSGIDRGGGGLLAGGELSHRLVLEEGLRRQRQPGGVRPDDDLEDLNGAATELEEVVVEADAGEAQHLGVELGEEALDGSDRQGLVRLRRGSRRGAGAPRRSTFPAAVSGSRASGTNTAGTR